MVGGGHARLFICDRRRAILEKFTSPPSCSTSVLELVSTRKSIFYEDRYAHTTLSNWAYRFDLSDWMQNFDVVEVWLQNFGSFLERDQSSALFLPANMNSSFDYNHSNNVNNVYSSSKSPDAIGSSAVSIHSLILLSVHTYYGLTTRGHVNGAPPTSATSNNHDAPKDTVVSKAKPYSTSSISTSERDHAHNNSNNNTSIIGTSSTSLNLSTLIPYHLLPSTQQSTTTLNHCDAPLILNEEMCFELSGMSGGRFERLAAQLRHIQPLHLVFNDHSFYQRRPTLLLFWFIKLLPNLRKLTLDCIQGDEQIELHRVLNVDNLDELTIIQPQQKACLLINENILDAFLDSRITNNNHSTRKSKFRLRFSGRTQLTAYSVCNFIKKWQNRREVVPFHSILIDALSIRPSDFVRAAMCVGDVNNYNNEVYGNEVPVLNMKHLVFRHRKFDVRIKYKYEDGYLMFTYFDPKEKARRRLPPTSPPVHRVVSFYSPISIYNNNNNTSDDNNNNYANSNKMNDWNYYDYENDNNKEYDKPIIKRINDSIKKSFNIDNNNKNGNNKVINDENGIMARLMALLLRTAAA
ncbi:unnamed protein product [Anisakis simplex]|uniref:FBA_2 domain-containing protein n=1 Tax=Anisakis simplex TaxID=6269 RepID=A0A0M3K3Y3_ANISI|nr:unnamed protein product [Anisakis simplex]